MSNDEIFEVKRAQLLAEMSSNPEFSKRSKQFFQLSVDLKYTYQFDWMGVPVIQMPSDLIVFQDIVYRTKPDIIIETGVARGGSLIFWASMLELFNPKGIVVGIDLKIHKHTKDAIAENPLSKRIFLIEGDSSSEQVENQVKKHIRKDLKCMVILDSHHSANHVYRELEIYSKLVTRGCYLLVLDTAIEDIVIDTSRPWGPGNSPKTAINRFVSENPNLFSPCLKSENISVTSVASGGFWIKN